MDFYLRGRNDVWTMPFFAVPRRPEHYPLLVDFRNARLVFEKALVW